MKGRRVALLAAGEGPPAGRLVARPVDRQPDGSKRLLGAYARLLVAVRPLRGRLQGGELDALEPTGTVRWSLARPARDRRPLGRHRDGHENRVPRRQLLHVVAGDGTGDRKLVARVAAVAPAWKPGGEHVLAYVTPKGRVRIVDADSGNVLGRPARRVAGAAGVLSGRRSDRGPGRPAAHDLQRAGVPRDGHLEQEPRARPPALPVRLPGRRQRRHSRSPTTTRRRTGARSRPSSEAAAATHGSSSPARAGSPASSGRPTASGCSSPGTAPTSGSSSARARAPPRSSPAPRSPSS